MELKRISILNYKNLEQVDLTFSLKMNCFLGQNGMGKTNLLDAIYYLSFCKSALNPIDSQNINHNEEFFMLQGFYRTRLEENEEVYCGLKRRQKKQFKRNKKEYSRLSDHIGFVPLVLISPSDSLLLAGGSEERRRFMDLVISQYDKEYLEALIRYNKSMAQRNTLLKQEGSIDLDVLSLWEEMMAKDGTIVYQKRLDFVEEFIPIFQDFYAFISKEQEQVNLTYQSHLAEGALLDILKESRLRDRAIGYSSKGIHKDDLLMQLGDFPMKREGSQGQNKSYLIALKLAQFDFLKRAGNGVVPILLLDDVFDKLDASRVEQLVKLVAGERFGQIFMTDTNRDHLESILEAIDQEYKLFYVEKGSVTERKGEE
ncbi:MAG: DNA replication/repair protein RecF [Phocaeicola sp.]